MLTAQEIKTAVSRYWSGRAAGFDLGPSHNVLKEAQHQAWLDLLREVAGPPATHRPGRGLWDGLSRHAYGRIGTHGGRDRSR